MDAVPSAGLILEEAGLSELFKRVEALIRFKPCQGRQIMLMQARPAMDTTCCERLTS